MQIALCAWETFLVQYYTEDVNVTLFLSKDLCQLVNADAPYWLVGMTEMTRTFGLELLESVLNDFPQVFLQVSSSWIENRKTFARIDGKVYTSLNPLLFNINIVFLKDLQLLHMGVGFNEKVPYAF